MNLTVSWPGCDRAEQPKLIDAPNESAVYAKLEYG